MSKLLLRSKNLAAAKLKIIPVVLWLILSLLGLPHPALADIPDEATISFGASPAHIRLGECTTLYWDAHRVREVYYNDQGVSGKDQQRVECPSVTTIYRLTVVGREGTIVTYETQVIVEQSGSSNPTPDTLFTFTADRFTISTGECTRLFWNIINVREVYYGDQPVAGDNQTRIECPRHNTTYHLRVIRLDGSQETRQITINVTDTDPAEQFGESIVPDQYEVDFDRRVIVSPAEDDFAWYWQGNEIGLFKAVDDDDDLRIFAVHQRDVLSFPHWSRSDCGSYLKHQGQREATLQEEMIACFRSDDGVYGKFFVEDIRSTNGQLHLTWTLWD